MGFLDGHCHDRGSPLTRRVHQELRCTHSSVVSGRGFDRDGVKGYSSNPSFLRGRRVVGVDRPEPVSVSVSGLQSSSSSDPVVSFGPFRPSSLGVPGVRSTSSVGGTPSTVLTRAYEGLGGTRYVFPLHLVFDPVRGYTDPRFCWVPVPFCVPRKGRDERVPRCSDFPVTVVLDPWSRTRRGLGETGTESRSDLPFPTRGEST